MLVKVLLLQLPTLAYLAWNVEGTCEFLWCRRAGLFCRGAPSSREMRRHDSATARSPASPQGSGQPSQVHDSTIKHTAYTVFLLNNSTSEAAVSRNDKSV